MPERSNIDPRGFLTDLPHRADAGGDGILIAIVGPSGAGKDTLIDAVRERFAADSRLHVARRTITWPGDAGGETHESLSTDAFAEQREAGAFVLSWDAHDLSYGIRHAETDQLATGGVVIANLSRRMLQDAIATFSRVAVASVVAAPETLATRLAERSRETPEEIAGRLAREAPLNIQQTYVFEIDNSDAVEEAIDRLCALVDACLNVQA